MIGAKIVDSVLLSLDGSSCELTREPAVLENVLLVIDTHNLETGVLKKNERMKELFYKND